MCNKVVDVVVAVVGWWLVVAVCICKYIPWISSMNALNVWIEDHPEQAGYEQADVCDREEGAEDAEGQEQGQLV